MDDISIRREGRAGRITFTRTKALNALSHEMAQAIHHGLKRWRDDAEVALVVIDAEGERAFCAGGDIAAVYREGKAGNHASGQRFFADEYRMNAAIKDYPKPIISFMQGFVMGGGVGVGGHAAIRVVGESTRIAMPETGIGLIPDVGGSFILGHAPGHVGEYLGLTGARIGPEDAIHAGFADRYITEAEWPALIAALVESGDAASLPQGATPAAPLAQADLAAFGLGDVAAIMAALEGREDEFAKTALAAMRRASPLSLAATLALVRAARNDTRLQDSLAREYRFTHRATAQSDFLEGVRAQIIDKDRNPVWHAPADAAAVAAMLDDLGADELSWEDEA